MIMITVGTNIVKVLQRQRKNDIIIFINKYLYK